MPSLLSPSVYESLAKPLLFRLEAEHAHNLTLRAAELAGRSAGVRRWLRKFQSVEHARLRCKLGALELRNPLGLAAGFDKNGRSIPLLDSLGFGLIEIGSVSAYPSAGNPRPRLFRLPRDRAVVVSYGVPNEGAEAVSLRLERTTHSALGINIVKTNDPRKPAVRPGVQDDYLTSFDLLHRHADYMTLNLSCPNSGQDRDFFDEPAQLELLLSRIATRQPELPVFLKIKPVTDPGILREVVAISDPFRFIAGFAINLPSNLPGKVRLASTEAELTGTHGAIAGPPASGLIDDVLMKLRSITGQTDRYTLVAAGGVSSADDAYRKIRLGASAVQLYTGLIYQGPGIVPQILSGLLRLLERDGFDRIADVVGVDADVD